MTIRRALLTAFFWVAIALVIDVWLFFAVDHKSAEEFLGAFSMEEALSLDNLFMFLLIFRTFHTPAEARPRALRWGMVGVIVMRGAIIIGGTTIIHFFRPLLWAFALFLFWSASKIFFSKSEESNLPEEQRQAVLEGNWLVKLSKRFLGFDSRFHDDQFFVTIDGKTRATMLLLTLIVIEGTDLPFAFDSLPAAMAVSQNPAIILASNILAVLSLRALYFIIENMQERFSHMKYGIGILLAVAGIKILLPDLGEIVAETIGRVYPGVVSIISPAYGIDVPLPYSLALIAAIIGVTIGYTLLKTRRSEA